ADAGRHVVGRAVDPVDRRANPRLRRGPAVVTRPRIALIVHGAVWPDPSRPATLRDRVTRLARSTPDVVVARDEPARPRGAAACVNEAMTRVQAEVVLVVDAAAPCSDEDLDRVLAAVEGRAAAPAVLAWLARPQADDGGPDTGMTGNADADAFDAMIRAAGTADAPGLDDPAVWAVRRDAWRAADGLDPQHLSVGAVTDLAARLGALGFDTTRLESWT